MTTIPERRTLDGVPKIGFYEGGPLCPEDLCLPSVIRSIACFLKDPLVTCGKRRAGPPAKIPCAYSFFTGVTGAGFLLSWRDGWHEENAVASYADADPAAMERRAFAALGLDFRRVTPRPGEDAHGLFLEHIDESLRRGLPLISYGLFGPPEPGLITGLDAGGDVLIGWDFFQNMGAGCQKEPSGQYRKADWAKNLAALGVIGEKRDRPALKEIFRGALECCRDARSMPGARPDRDAPEGPPRRHNGHAAYTAWAEHLLRDQDFTGVDEAILRRRHGVHDNCVGALAEARWYASRFLLDMAGHVDESVHRDAIEDILSAAGLYAGEHALMWKAWDSAGGLGNPEAWRRFAEADVRRSIASLIREARDKDEAAAARIEKALAVMQEERSWASP